MSSEFVAQSHTRSDTSSTFRFVWSQIRRYPLVIGGLIFGAFSNAALASLMPYLIGEAFNAVNQPTPVRRSTPSTSPRRTWPACSG